MQYESDLSDQSWRIQKINSAINSNRNTPNLAAFVIPIGICSKAAPPIGFGMGWLAKCQCTGVKSLQDGSQLNNFTAPTPKYRLANNQRKQNTAACGNNSVEGGVGGRSCFDKISSSFCCWVSAVFDDDQGSDGNDSNDAKIDRKAQPPIVINPFDMM